MTMYECHIYILIEAHRMSLCLVFLKFCTMRVEGYFFSHFLITSTNSRKTQLSYQKASTKSPPHTQKISVNFVSREDVIITILYTIYHPPHTHTQPGSCIPQYVKQYVAARGQHAGVGSFLHKLGPRGQNQVARLDSKCLCLLSHPAYSPLKGKMYANYFCKLY